MTKAGTAGGGSDAFLPKTGFAVARAFPKGDLGGLLAMLSRLSLLRAVVCCGGGEDDLVGAA